MAETMNIAEIRQRAKMPAKQAGGKTVQGFFEHSKAALTAVLPQHIKADRLLLFLTRQLPRELVGKLLAVRQLSLQLLNA